MEKQEYIIAFGYGIKEKYFSNRYGDIRVLIAHPKNDGSYYTSTIKSNTGGVAKHYVRFLTKEDAQRYIDEKLGSGYTYFKAKESRILKLLDSNYNMYIGGVTAPAGVQLHESLSKPLRNYIIDKSILNTLNELSDKGDYLQMRSSDINKITEFFFSGLDIDIGTDRYFLGYHLHINNTKFDDNGVNIDLKVNFNFSYLNFEETTTEMEISEILDDADEHFKSRIYSVQNEIDKGHELQLNIFIKYTDLKDSISDDVGESIRFRYEIVNLIAQEIWNSILHSKPGSTNYQNVTNFRTEIRGIVTKLISIAKDYAKTEVFMESYKDKDVGSVTEPTGYVKKGGFITPGLNSDDIDKDICKILNYSIGYEYYCDVSDSALDKITEFFLSGLDIESGWEDGFLLCAPLRVKKITPNDEGINVDLLLKVYFPYGNFRETITQMKLYRILSTDDEYVKTRINSVRNVNGFYHLPFNIFISYTDLKDSIKDMWDGGSRNYTSLKFKILKLMGKTVEDSILNLEPGSTNYQNVINLRTRVRETTLELISIIREYYKTELFMESYKDKTVQDILHDLYEGKVK